MLQHNKGHILHILLHPLVVAIPFAIITILLLPVEFSKNRIETISHSLASKSGKNTIQYYHDLDGDGVDEEISHFINNINQCAVKISCHKMLCMGQWNFNGFLPEGSRNLLYLDYDHNGHEDVFTLYQRQDSVFMGGINPCADSLKLMEDLFIDKINIVNETTDFSSKLYHYDLNGDGIDEAIINISAEYSELPRRLYAYDFVTQKLIKSPLIGFIIDDVGFVDIDDDGHVDIVTTTVSYENIEKGLGIPFNDYERWFVVFDHNLNFKYGPLKTGVGSGSVHSMVIPSKPLPLTFVIDFNNESKNRMSIYLFDVSSEKLDSLQLPFEMGEASLFIPCNVDGRHLLTCYSQVSGTTHLMDPHNGFKVLQQGKITPGMKYIKTLAVGQKESLEHLFDYLDSNTRFIKFFSNDLQQNTSNLILPEQVKIKNLSTLSTTDKKNCLALQLDEKMLISEINYNPFWLFKIIFLWLIVFGFYSALIWFILWAQKKFLHTKYLRAQTLAELKLKSIRNQMDPHFTFNAVNAIASAIYKEDRDTAYTYFSLFSKLIRSTMLYSDRMSRLLEQEIEFTKNYLKIEKFRFGEKFTSEIIMDENVNLNMEVPRMIIQTFAESAITNGLMHRQHGGHLQITLSVENGLLQVYFDDNGVGIMESKRFNKEKAFRSIRLMDEFLAIFNDLNQSNISWEMFDLENEGEFPGSRVIVKLPLILKYNYRDNY